MQARGPAHDRGRTPRAFGHDVRLIPAACVKFFVNRNETDARDAGANREAARRPSMRTRTVAVKSVARQSARALETARTGMVRPRTGHLNTVRGPRAEFGIIAAPGMRGFAVPCQLIEAADPSIPPTRLPCLTPS